MSAQRGAVVAISGGIGGAKLVLGLSRIMRPEDLVVIVNTADDFEHLGLAISPDLDTVMYTLAGLDDPQRGWGRRDESWKLMSALAALGGETWFALGDADLATHIERTRRLRAGETLSNITADFCRRLGITTRIVPMSDDKVRTRLETDRGLLEFQDYFVRQRCAPVVLKVVYAGATDARAHPDAVAALQDFATASRGDLSLQSAVEHRTGAFLIRHPGGPCPARSSGYCSVSHHRWPCSKGSNREDDG